MIGSKLVSELVPTTPGKEFVYATVELESLEPDYVALGRIRPNDGPLIQGSTYLSLIEFESWRSKSMSSGAKNWMKRS